MKTKKIDFEFTGTVRDAQTNEPIEGAYVIAFYGVFFSGQGMGPKVFCQKTKGMYTGKSGEFHFPMEGLDGISPENVAAIKPGYFTRRKILYDNKIPRSQAKKNYTNRDVFLQKQDPQRPNFQLGARSCERPLSREAIAANVDFLKIELAELSRLGLSGIEVEGAVNGIRLLELNALTTEQIAPKVERK